MSLKGFRVASDIKKVISEALIKEAKDEDFKFVTITYVDATNDLSFAKIYFTTLKGDKEKIEKDLNKAAGFFRTIIAKELNIRHTPELKFVFDESIEYAKNIEKIIEKINIDD